VLSTKTPASRHQANSAFCPLRGTENEYRQKCGDAPWLESKGRYGSFHLWINVWVPGKTVWSLVNTCHTWALYTPFTRYNQLSKQLNNRFDNLLNVCLNFYTTQPVVHPVVQSAKQPDEEPVVSCKQTFNQLNNRLFNWLHEFNMFDPCNPSSNWLGELCKWA